MSGTYIAVPAVDPRSCPASDVLERVGDRWSVLVVTLLGRRTHRFNELHRAVEGISQRMLTRTLRGLERDGLASRTVHPTVPPSVGYALTDLGKDFLTQVLSLGTWAVAHHDEMRAARARYADREPA
jgi:DNA-binding HxlR family transcriptional regulator